MSKCTENMDSVLIIGSSGHAKVITEVLELNMKYVIHGFLDTYKSIGEQVMGYDILGDEYHVPELIKKGITKGVIAIGDNWSRYKMVKKIQEIAPEFEFITVLHPEAVISPYTRIGKGTVILASVVINTDAIIGEFCILNTAATFGHEAIMKDFSSIAPRTTVGGNVKIGAFSAISIGASIIQGICIGEHTIVGAGAVVTKSIPDFKVSYGVPSKIKRNRVAGDHYLTTSLPLDNMTLECLTVASQEDIEIYRKSVQALNIQNPFCMLELLDTTDMKGYELRYFVLKRKDKLLIIMPLYIRSIEINGQATPYFDVTSPYGYGGPLYDARKHNANRSEMMHYFWNEVDQWYKDNAIVSEFIRFSLNDNHKGYTGECTPSLMNIKGKITDFEKIWVNFKPKVRNNYRKAQQEELSLKLYSDAINIEIIKDFYDIYIQTMQRNNADDHYFHFIDYFKALIENNPKRMLIAMVYKDEIPISTELILVGEHVLYSYLGGTISDYFYTRPNDFLKIEVMKWAQENNFKYYILGGGRQDGDGLYKYKKSFFPDDDDVIYHTGRKIINKEVYTKLIEQQRKDDADKYLDEISTHYFPAYRKINI